MDMVTRTRLLILISVLLVSAEGQTQPKNNCSKVRLSPADLKRVNPKSILFLIADDRSGSTNTGTQPARITESQYRDLLEIFIEKGYVGHFAIRIIGNTPHSGFEESIAFDPTYESKAVAKGARLTEKARLLCINQRIQDTNNIIVGKNKRRIDDYMTRIIIPKSINYKPNGEDKTDIYTAFRDIEMKANLGTRFHKIIVVVMSDGIDSKNKALSINTQLPFDLILIGWPFEKKIRNQNELRLGSVDDLITWFKNIKI